MGPVGEEGERPRGRVRPYRRETPTKWTRAWESRRQNDELALDLPEGNYQTLAGFILERLGTHTSGRRVRLLQETCVWKSPEWTGSRSSGYRSDGRSRSRWSNGRFSPTLIQQGTPTRRSPGPGPARCPHRKNPWGLHVGAPLPLSAFSVDRPSHSGPHPARENLSVATVPAGVGPTVGTYPDVNVLNEPQLVVDPDNGEVRPDLLRLVIQQLARFNLQGLEEGGGRTATVSCTPLMPLPLGSMVRSTRKLLSSPHPAGRGTKKPTCIRPGVRLSRGSQPSLLWGVVVAKGPGGRRPDGFCCGRRGQRGAEVGVGRAWGGGGSPPRARRVGVAVAEETAAPGRQHYPGGQSAAYKRSHLSYPRGPDESPTLPELSTPPA